MNYQYKIYRVPNYLRTAHSDENAYISTDINDIINELASDKSYHMQLNKNIAYKLFFDLDNVVDEDQFNALIRFLDIEYGLDHNLLSYTKSINSKTNFTLFAFNIVYPLIHLSQ